MSLTRAEAKPGANGNGTTFRPAWLQSSKMVARVWDSVVDPGPVL